MVDNCYLIKFDRVRRVCCHCVDDRADEPFNLFYIIFILLFFIFRQPPRIQWHLLVGSYEVARATATKIGNKNKLCTSVRARVNGFYCSAASHRERERAIENLLIILFVRRRALHVKDATILGNGHTDARMVGHRQHCRLIDEWRIVLQYMRWWYIRNFVYIFLFISIKDNKFLLSMLLSCLALFDNVLMVLWELLWLTEQN